MVNPCSIFAGTIILSGARDPQGCEIVASSQKWKLSRRQAVEEAVLLVDVVSQRLCFLLDRKIFVGLAPWMKVRFFSFTDYQVL